MRTLQKIALYCAYALTRLFYNFFLLLNQKIEKVMTKKRFLNNFEKKYDREELASMALCIPKGTPLHIGDVQPIFPALGKNKIYEIIELRKKINKNKNKTQEFYSLHMREILDDLA